MITSAKPATMTQQEDLQEIKFLNLDGTQTTDETLLVNNAYVSRRDHNKYGKVEDYTSGRKRFYLKQFRGGRPGELLVDPYGMMAKAGDLSAYVTQRGERFCEYVEVCQELYNCYVTYLKTRDIRYFRTCEKELLDRVL